MAEKIASELRGQIPESQREEVIMEVRGLLAMGVSPIALQIALQLPSSKDLALLILNTI